MRTHGKRKVHVFQVLKHTLIGYSEETNQKIEFLKTIHLNDF